MGLRIRTNVASLSAQKSLDDSTRENDASLERLASGKRINKSSDDAAGLAISNSLEARIRSIDAAKQNASNGISLLQISEGGLNEISNILIKMRELGSESASDTLDNRERSFLDKEFQELKKEITRITLTTEFNGRQLLNAKNNDSLQIFVGSNSRATDNPNYESLDADEDPEVITIDFSELEQLDEKLGEVVEDGFAVVPDDEDGGANDLGNDGTVDLFEKIDDALNGVASYRATVGSVQSRLNSVIDTLDVSNENLSAANSRISDVDYASETAQFTKTSILQAAGVSVLSQANNAPQLALSLLN